MTEVVNTNALSVVRTFNRTVVERTGALSDHYLSGDRPLGPARVLWEIGPAGCEVATLRSRLALDSGYLSRLLRSLEGAGLITLTASATDQRRRRATLTAAGTAERALLDQRSDELAQTILQPLTDSQQVRLLAAMATVTQLLAAAAVELRVVDPDDPAAQHCLREYFIELDHRFERGFDLTASLPNDSATMRSPRGTFVLATLHDEPVGCGALKFHPGGVAELKRLWVSATARGLGLGRRLLLDLEERAAMYGARVVRLDTNAALDEAIALYRKVGYREIPAFNQEPYADLWFEKALATDSAQLGA